MWDGKLDLLLQLGYTNEDRGKKGQKAKSDAPWTIGLASVMVLNGNKGEGRWCALVHSFTKANLCDTPFCNVSRDNCAIPP